MAGKSKRPSRPAGRPRSAQSPRARTYRRGWRLNIGRSSIRIRAFMLVMAMVVVVVLGRAVQLQALDAQALAATAAKQSQRVRDLEPTRGEITDRNGVVLAASEPTVIVSLDPWLVRNNNADTRYPLTDEKREEMAAAPDAVADILVEHLGGRKDTYLALIEEESRYEVVAKEVPAATYQAIKDDMALGIDQDGERPWYGVFSEASPTRTYPNRSVASNVIGFVDWEQVGRSGLEASLNEELSGQPGTMSYDSSNYGRIPLGENVLEPAVDGVDYSLTIDADLNFLAEQALAKGMANSGAETGTVVVMNVNNGEVLALANGPSFDPNEPGDSDQVDWGNRAVDAAYEPGSVQKVLTMAALADQGLVTPDTKVVVPPRIASGDGYVSDSFDHGTLNLTARGVVAQSSNIGTIELARQMDKADLSEYLVDFGLGEKPATGLPNETSGSVPAKDMADYTRDQISFGQGLSVSAVQMAAAVSAAVNGGTYYQPKIIKSATASDGTELELSAQESRQVVSQEASEAVVNMMEAVITAKDGRAIPGYRTIGKSGTAQRYDETCKCYSGYTSSFVGVAPAEDPQILVYVVLDKPTNGNLGSELALPVVNEILSAALPRYNVLPSTTEAKKEALTFQ